MARTDFEDVGGSATLIFGEDKGGTRYPLPAGMEEGGITELIGTDEQVDQDDYSASVGVDLGSTVSGEILQILLVSTEEDAGSVQTPSGHLIFLDADPSVSAGDTALGSGEHATIIGSVEVAADDWVSDANGGWASIKTKPIAFHALQTIYAVWLHTDATSFNDGGTDDEVLEFNFWFRRDN